MRIADVSHYVKPQTQLWHEALKKEILSIWLWV